MQQNSYGSSFFYIVSVDICGVRQDFLMQLKLRDVDIRPV